MTPVIMAFALEADEVLSPEGLTRASAWIPAQSSILHLGTVPNSQVIAIYALVTPPKRDAQGIEIPYKREELKHMEFIVASIGSTVPPKGYKFRAPVRTNEGILIFLFEKESGIYMLGNGGVG